MYLCYTYLLSQAFLPFSCPRAIYEKDTDALKAWQMAGADVAAAAKYCGSPAIFPLQVMVLSIELQFRCGRVLLGGAPRAFKLAIVLLEVDQGHHDYSCKV